MSNNPFDDIRQQREAKVHQQQEEKKRQEEDERRRSQPAWDAERLAQEKKWKVFDQYNPMVKELLTQLKDAHGFDWSIQTNQTSWQLYSSYSAPVSDWPGDGNTERITIHLVVEIVLDKAQRPLHFKCYRSEWKHSSRSLFGGRREAGYVHSDEKTCGLSRGELIATLRSYKFG